ncbi:MAG TPA: hypothetical protein VMV48_06715 [Gallionellaceae bacterium]|nr:hypothetical protein [Gallionellaceae bacterium]
MEAELQQRIAAARDRGVALLAGLRGKLARLSLPGEPITIPDFDNAKFTLEHDLYNGQNTLLASFYLSPSYRAGYLMFHSDGSSLAEYHVMRLYPGKPHLFIESVEAWVRDGEIKTDLKTAEMPK